MLEAQIQQLNAQLLQNAVLLRKKELDFYLTWIQFMLFCAAIIFVNGLNGIVFPVQSPLEDQTLIFKIAFTLYIVSNALAASLEFAVITCGLFAMLLGPGLALRGPDGSMDKAVEGLKDVIASMFRMFIAGLGFAQLALFMYFWVAESILEWPLALVLNLLVLGFSGLLVRKTLFVYNLFWFDKNLSVAGALTRAAGGFAVAGAGSPHGPATPQGATTIHAASAQSSNMASTASYAPTSRPQNTYVNSDADAAIGGAARPVKKKKKGIW
jgi:hypothetical protein